MTRRTRVWLIIAAALMVAGIVCCGISFYLAQGNLSAFSTDEYQTMEYEPKGDYVAISIATETADIVFHPSPDGKTRVVCRENVKSPHTAVIEDNFLKVTVKNQKQWYDFISIGDFHEEERIDIYIPRATYNALYIDGDTCDVSIPEGFVFWTMDINLSTGDVYLACSTSGDTEINTDTGDITLESLEAGPVDLETDTGLINISDMNCHSLKIESGSGDVVLKNVCTAESFGTEANFVVDTDTGDIKLISCDGYGIEIDTDTGDVHGSLITDKRVYAESATGDINIPPLPDDFGMSFCKVETDTGNIFIEIEN